MSKDSETATGGDRERLLALMGRFRGAPVATAADRSAKDQILDELQDAVGLSGKMATAADIIRRAERLIQGS